MEQEKVETGVDFLQCLDTYVSMRIMSFLDDPSDVVRASAVSRLWQQFVLKSGLAKQLCLKKFPELSNIVSIQIPSEETVITADDKRAESRVYGSLLQDLTKSKTPPMNCIANTICASTTDHYPEESIANTLNPRDRFLRRGSYWSSKGQSDPEALETLIYKLHAGFWIITEVDIQPFKAFFEPGKPLYASKSVRFRVGHPKNQTEFESETTQLPLQKPADDEFVWYYTSPEFEMEQEDYLQQFKLPEPVVCIGGYMQIELLGGTQRVQKDGLFYICVCHVRIMGRPLSPAFEVETLEQGKFLLKYHPKKLDLKKCSYHDKLVDEMVSQRERLLENLLGEIRLAPNYPFNWDNWAADSDDDEPLPIIRPRIL